MPIRKQFQLLKALPSFKTFLFLGLLLIGPISPADTTQNSNHERPQIEEEHDTKHLDNLLIDYNKDQDKALKDAAKLINNNDSTELTENELSIEDEIDPPRSKNLNSKKKIDPKTLKTTKYSDALKVALTPLQNMSEKDLIKLLIENTRGSKVAVYIDRFPKLAVFAVRLIKDKHALPNLASIIDNQDRLIKFYGVMILTILIAILLKRFMKREGRSVLKALSFWFFRFSIITSLRIGIAIYFYGKQLMPAFDIATNTFFK